MNKRATSKAADTIACIRKVSALYFLDAYATILHNFYDELATFQTKIDTFHHKLNVFQAENSFLQVNLFSDSLKEIFCNFLFF